jgi:hypothetical protein
MILWAGVAAAQEGEAPAPEAPASEPAPEVDDEALPSTLLGGTSVGKRYDAWVAWKDERIPLQISGWHWAHVRQSGPLASDYGVPGTRGTYYYSLRFYPELETTNEDFTRVGVTVDVRFRDDEDLFRPFYESTIWLWEAYGWVDTVAGRLKAGKVWRRFGLDWDGSFWGSVPYFDGHELDPDWGVSLEGTVELSGSVTMESFAQFFFRDDRVNGSLVGADPESVRRSGERDTVVLRWAPTWRGTSVSVTGGLSATVGRVLNRRAPGAQVGVDDELVGAVALDATVALGDVKLFGEVTQAWGTLTPAHYVSGGPSNKRATGLIGAQVGVGPATARLTYSVGWYDNPAAWQDIIVGGVTLAVTKNIDLYVEYVLWGAHGAPGDSYATFEDGYQLVLNWRF